MVSDSERPSNDLGVETTLRAKRTSAEGSFGAGPDSSGYPVLASRGGIRCGCRCESAVPQSDLFCRGNSNPLKFNAVGVFYT